MTGVGLCTPLLHNDNSSLKANKCHHLLDVEVLISVRCRQYSMAYYRAPPDESASPDLAARANMSYPEPNSTLQSRNPFRRHMSSSDPNTQEESAATHNIDIADGAGDIGRPTNEGLGIIGSVGNSKYSPVASLPLDGGSSTRSFLSPGIASPGFPSAQLSRKNTKQGAKSVGWEVSQDQESLHSSPYFPHTSSSDRELLSPSQTRHGSEPGLPHFDCQTDGAIIGAPWSWLSTTILVLAVYSTVFSAIYLVIALMKPRYGKKIGTNGHMTISTAALLSAAFAKTVELSFVTVFVAFLGQVLSRRAFLAKARGGGISIAEMMMRTWIMQPGTLITHWEAVRYAALSAIGMVALIAAFVAMFYTTAAEALVAPKLRLGPLEHKVLYGEVSATFANSVYLAKTCPTPIDESVDPVKGTTCLGIQHAGQAYHNYQIYLDGWAKRMASGNISSIEYAARPPPVGVMFENTTVRGQWITPSQENVSADSTTRLVQNVTMAMPHANVFNAARDRINDIMQPEDLNQGSGEYSIKASVPAPAVNILCAGVTEDDIKSLIYVKWPTNNGTFNISTWATEPPSDMIRRPAYPNATEIDHLFGFGPETGDARQRAPIFPKLPLPYNTLVNGTGVWPSHSIYLLAASPTSLATSPYLFCSLKAMQYPGCTTQYHAARSGGRLTVHCDDDPENSLPYQKSRSDAHSGIWNPDWKNVASEWANSLSLGAGIADGAASNARLLTQMIPEYNNKTHVASLSPSLPSIGEALGVLSGCNLMLSSQWSPFIHYWNYSTTKAVLDSPQYQAFNASLSYVDYASGPTKSWQGMFYVVLVTVFLTNCFCLVYLLWTIRGEGQVTDYTEPQNLFALAVNSPPSRSLSGACGAGPEGDMLGKKWEVDMQKPVGGGGGHPHFYMKCGDDDRMDAFNRLRQRKSRLSMRSVEDFEVAESPAVEQYTMLASKRKTLL